MAQVELFLLHIVLSCRTQCVYGHFVCAVCICCRVAEFSSSDNVTGLDWTNSYTWHALI